MGLQARKPGSGAADMRGEAGAGRGRWARWVPWFALLYILVAGLFVAWAKMETIQLTYEVHQLRAERGELQRAQRILDAERAELQSPVYLTERAVELGLEEAPPGVVIRVE